MALIARYKLDETTGTTAADSIGSVTGTNTGGVTIDQFGIDGRSYLFDGVDDYIDLGNNFAFERTDSFSISAWIKTTSSAQKAIVSKRDNTSNVRGWEFQKLADNTLALSLSSVNASNRLVIQGTSTNLNNGTWRHVVVTYDGSSTPTGVGLYIDGVLETNSINTNTLSTTILNSAPAVIGSREGVNSFFDGNIDDVRIYDNELSAGDVTTLYNSYDLLNTVLLAHYKLDETTGTTAVDSVNGVDGIVTGGVTLNQTGKVGQSYLLDGATGLIDLVQNFAFERTDKFTIAAWVSTAGGTTNTIMSKRLNSGSFQGYEFFVDQVDTLSLSLVGSSNRLDIETTSTIPLGQFFHAACTYDGSSSAAGVELYINGVAQGTFEITDTLSTTILNAGAVTTLGGRTGPSSLLTGNLDDVKIFDTNLSAEQVKLLYGVDDYSHYTLDETSGTAVLDSINGITGTNTGGAVVNQPGKIGASYLFDGVDDSIDFTNSDFTFERTDPFSISAWVNTTTLAANQDIFSKGNASGQFEGYSFQINSSGLLSVNLIGNLSNRISIDTVSALTTGTFIHVVLTYDGSSTAAGVKLYVDSVEQAVTVNNDNLSITLLNSALACIGSRNSTINSFNGNLDDVRIYPTELTQFHTLQLFEDANSSIVIDPNTAIQIEWVQQAVVGTPGVGDISLGAAVTGFIRFQDDDRVSDITVLNYVIEDGDNRERGVGYYLVAGDVFVRDTIQATLDTGVFDRVSPTPLNLSSSAIIFTSALT